MTVTKGAQRSLHIEIAHCDHDTLFGGVVAMTLLPVLTARGPVRNVCVGRSTGLLGELALLCRMTKGKARQVNAGRDDAPVSQHSYMSESWARSWNVSTLTRERESQATLTETRRVRETQLECLPPLHDRKIRVKSCQRSYRRFGNVYNDAFHYLAPGFIIRVRHQRVPWLYTPIPALRPSISFSRRSRGV